MKKKIKLENFKKSFPYIITGIATLGILFYGSIYKNSRDETLKLSAFNTEDYNISVDQLSELYIVADISNALNLASSEDLASNYVIATSLYDAGYAAVDSVEKPTIIDVTGLSRGVKTHIVKEGETLDQIAAAYGLTTDQVRWSNGLKNKNISVGTTLYLTDSKSPGIVYTVKANDTIDSIASKYGSTAAAITYLNNLDVTGLTEGMKIAIEGGTLPEKERPEYVPPRPTSTYTYLGNTSSRINIQALGKIYGLGGPYVAGQCTQWAWYHRQDLPGNLGNAKNWASNAQRLGFPVDNNPRPGDVFQTPFSYRGYGHVGYVEAVNDDGTITVTEMNYGSSYNVIRAQIPASQVHNYNYIHKRG